MSDPRDEMRRILHRRPEKKLDQESKQSFERADDAHDIVEYINVVRDDDPIVVQCLSGFLKMADDALDAAVSCLDD